MKNLLFSLSTSAVLLSLSAAADTVNLTDPSGIPVPPGTHVDSYLFPISLLNISNPITNLNVSYESIAPPGYHEIVSTTLLFDPAQVARITPVSSTLTHFEALVDFSVPVTAVSSYSAPVFWAVHGQIGGGANYTWLDWTVSYLDGSRRTAGNGIIPEQSTVSMIFLSGLMFCVDRCCRVRSPDRM